MARRDIKGAGAGERGSGRMGLRTAEENAPTGMDDGGRGDRARPVDREKPLPPMDVGLRK